MHFSLAVLPVLASMLIHCLAVPEDVLAEWQYLPSEAVPNIQTERELRSLQYISPILKGGFGNILYELAAAHSFAKLANVSCIVAWWDQSEADDIYKPYHGRGDPAPGISLKHIFPNLHFVGFFPRFRDVKSKSFDWVFKRYVRPSESLLTLKTPYTNGYFFHPRCLFGTLLNTLPFFNHVIPYNYRYIILFFRT